MKIVTWNVNGIRAFVKKGAFDEMMKMDADVYLVQETKAEKEQLSEETQSPNGFHGYFWSSQVRKGHAGVAIFSRTKPDEVIYGLPDGFDEQGRVVTGIFGETAVVCAYLPNGGSKTSSLSYKKEFYQKFLAFLKDLRETGYEVIVGADYNICHTEIDIARPKENKNKIGFLPEERAILDAFHEEGFVDAWRFMHPETTNVYTWWSLVTRARERNVGWRIDSFYIESVLLEEDRVRKVEVLGDMMGSDHCPVVIEISE